MPVSVCVCVWMCCSWRDRCVALEVVAVIVVVVVAVLAVVVATMYASRTTTCGSGEDEGALNVRRKK